MKIQYDFLWAEGALENRNLINLAACCRVKRHGVLGIRSLTPFNQAFLTKWNWCCVKENQALWREVICGKYGGEENLRLEKRHRSRE